MTRTNERHRSLFLAGLIVAAAAVGAVGTIGTVGAQDAGNETGENASEEEFYSPSADDPLNARFRDCCANTVDSTDGGVLNFNIVYGPAEGTYDVDISASNLSEEQIDAITYDNDTELSPTGLERTDIVGMNFTGVPAGEYDFTVTVVGEDAETTVPLEITGESAANAAANQSATDEPTTAEDTATATDTSANETGATNGTTTDTSMANETTADTTTTTTANETEMGGNTTTMTNGTGNASIVAETSAANASMVNHTVAVTVPSGVSGNLTNVTVRYGEANVSFGVMFSALQSVSHSGSNLSAGNVTGVVYGPSAQNVTFSFEPGFTASEGDQLTMTYGAVTNPPEPGNYTATIAVNGVMAAEPTLDITEANESAMTTTTGGTETTENGTTMTETTGTNETTGTAEETTQAEMGATADATRTTQADATTADNGDTTADDGETAANGTNGSGGTETTAAGGPGFTLIAGVVALLAAALVVARRD